MEQRTKLDEGGGGILDVAQDVLSNYYNYVGKTKILINDNFFVVSSSQLIKSITHNVKDLGGLFGGLARERGRCFINEMLPSKFCYQSLLCHRMNVLGHGCNVNI